MSTQSLRFGRTKIPPDQSSTKHPHLSIVQIFKEPLHPAAKKRDYEQPTPPRQASRTPNLQLRDPRLPRHTTHQNSARTAKEPRSISTQKTLSSTPQTPTHAKKPKASTKTRRISNLPSERPGGPVHPEWRKGPRPAAVRTREDASDYRMGSVPFRQKR